MITGIKKLFNSFHVFSLFPSLNRNTHENLIEFSKKHHRLSLGTLAFDCLNSLYTTPLVYDIKKLSLKAQTSCLEGFHATLNYWHPKMIYYSWLGSTCRYKPHSYKPLLKEIDVQFVSNNMHVRRIIISI